jgi:hypothetical protein
MIGKSEARYHVVCQGLAVRGWSGCSPTPKSESARQLGYRPLLQLQSAPATLRPRRPPLFGCLNLNAFVARLEVFTGAGRRPTATAVRTTLRNSETRRREAATCATRDGDVAASGVSFQATEDVFSRPPSAAVALALGLDRRLNHMHFGSAGGDFRSPGFYGTHEQSFGTLEQDGGCRIT